jgi:hypothetical protein
VRRIALAALFLEVGIVLLVVPWSKYWDRNYFVESLPVLRLVLTNNFMRGAVAELGVVNVLVAITEFGAMLFTPRPQSPLTVLGSSSAEDS